MNKPASKSLIAALNKPITPCLDNTSIHERQTRVRCHVCNKPIDIATDNTGSGVQYVDKHTGLTAISHSLCVRL